MNMYPSGRPIVAAFIVLSCLIGAAACDRTVRRDDAFFTQDDAAVEVGRNVEILYSDSARVRVRVSSVLLHNYIEKTNPRQEFPNGVKVDFLNANTTIQSTLTSKTATRLPDKGQIIARDSVVMTTVKQEKLETEELTWDEKTAKIRTEKFVKVSKPDEIIYGYGLEAEQDFSYWRILVPKGRIKVDSIQ
jgi:LPS export ABC transporter protein LptC